MNTKLLYYRQKLAELIGESVVDSWLNSPNKAFDNKKPIDMINKEDTELLDEMIYYKKKRKNDWFKHTNSLVVSFNKWSKSCL